MSEIHPKIRTFVFEKLKEDLKFKSLVSWKNELWLLDLETKDWYLTISSQSESWYNQDFFKLYLSLFSITNRQLSSILKEWVESNFEVRISRISRRQSNMTYYIDGMIRSEKNGIDLKNRFGFSYDFVKKFVEIKKEDKSVVLENFIPYL